MHTTKAGEPRNNTDEIRGFRPAERDGKFLTTVNDVEFHFADPVPDGGQILGEAGFLPAGDHVLIQLLRHGTRSVGLDEPVDLRQEGTEAFRAFKSDCVFRFTISDRGYEWGSAKITEPELRRIAGVEDDETLVLERDGVDKVLDAADILDLGDFGTEHLRISKRFVTVYLDNDIEKKIPGGTYTTEELIRVLDVEAGYLLNVLDAQGKLVPLQPGQTIPIKDGMKFFTQVPCGGSS